MLYKWVLYGLGAAICFGCMMLIYKKLLLLNLHPLVLNFFVLGMAFIGFAAWISISRTPIKMTTNLFLLLILASGFAVLGNYFDVNAIKNAPNPGYSTSLKATQIIIVTLLAPLLFGSPISIQKFVGVLIVFVGIFLISR